jgi:hypothetical protein
MATSLLAFLVSTIPALPSIQAFHRSYGPKAEIKVSAPTLQWEVWPSDGAQVTGVSMEINGREVDASYNNRLRRLEYQPVKPFNAGKYDVRCRVTVAGKLQVKKDWSFQVSSDAIPSLPAPDTVQVASLSEVNIYRRSLGLDAAHHDSRLNAASLAHVRYLSLNKRTGHYEKEGEPGFIGVTPSDRLETFGYCGSSWECVTFNSGGVRESVRDLFDAPYHRIPFLQPGAPPIGTGMVGRNFGIKFGDSHETGISVSPGSNQSGVSTSWSGNEVPNPLRMHAAPSGAVGYPIVFAFFGENYPSIKLASASLSSGGMDVPMFVNTSVNDDRLEGAIIMIPKRPLAPSARYDVEVEAVANNGKTVQKRWSFTTGAK